MSHNIFSVIESAVRQIARRNMAAHEYDEFIAGLRRTKMVRTGNDHITLHDYMLNHANDIANWATDNGFQHFEDRVEERKRQAIHNITTMFGWN